MPLTASPSVQRGKGMSQEEQKGRAETVRIRIPLEFRKKGEGEEGGLEEKVELARLTAPIAREPARAAQQQKEVSADRDPFCNQLLLNIYDGLIITDLEGRIIETNARASTLLRYRPEEFLGRQVTDLIDGADESLLKDIGQNISHEKFTMIEGFCQRREGGEFPAEVTVNMIRLPDRELFCFFVRDITKRMELEIELLRLSKAAESAADAICITDQEGHHVYQNPAFTELFGYTFEQLVADGGIVKLFADEEVERAFADGIDAAGAWAGEVEMLRRNGRKRIPVYMRANAIRDEEGEMLGLICVHTDMTERRRAELELRRAHDDLEKRVTERTQELQKSNERLQKEVSERKHAEEELKRYARDLEHSNRELQQFAYVASHDLQEPLRAVVSYLQLLERRHKEALSEDAIRFIDRSVAAGKRMQNLIRDLLEYSRVGTNGAPFVEVNINSVVETVLEGLHLAIEETGAEVIFGDLPTVVADPGQIEQLLQNLIANAIKFRRGDPLVTISARRVEKARKKVDRGGKSMAELRVHEGWLFSVEDNGIGIEQEFAGRIFRIFQRLHTVKEHPGTGIGLAICRKIVERHGGDIWVQSEPEYGATFYFTLPDLPAQKQGD